MTEAQRTALTPSTPDTRLLDLAEALETLPDEPPATYAARNGFYMGEFWHKCGTPSCALGYARHFGLLPPESSTIEEYAVSSAALWWLFGAEHTHRSAHDEARVIREFVRDRAGAAAASYWRDAA